MRRIAAVLLTLIIFAGASIPALEVYGAGWQQPPVSDLTITNMPSTGDTYTIQLNWEQPIPVTRDNRADDSSPVYAENFNLYYRNATKRETQGAIRDTVAGIQSASASFGYGNFRNMRLDPNSLYEFTVTPVKNNIYPVTNPDGSPGFERTAAPVDRAAAPERRALYLTELQVASAVGSGNKLIVTWYNPTLDGTNVFTAYDIYWQEEAGMTGNISQDPVTVKMDDPALVFNRDGTLTYTFTDDSLKIGVKYVLKAEPRVGGLSLRRDNLDNLTINGQNYSIAYRPFLQESRNEAHIKPSLNAVSEGSRFVRLEWNTLKTGPTGDQPKRVQVYESSEPEPNTDENGLLLNRKLIGTIDDTAVYNINYWLHEHGGNARYYQIIITYGSSSGDYLMESEVAYYDPAFQDFTPYKPDILGGVVAGASPRHLDVTWLAFSRPPYNEDEDGGVTPLYFDRYIDRNILYDIYVTDVFDNFNDALFDAYPINTTPLSGVSLPLSPYPDATSLERKPSYNTRVTDYYTLDPVTGGYIRKPLDDNKVYYVKIVAARTTGQKSQAAYGSVFLPPEGDISLDPKIIAAPPLKVLEVTDINITVQWDTKFLEMYRPDDDQWYAVVGKNKGKVIYGKSAMDIEKNGADDWFVLNEMADQIHLLDTANPPEVSKYLQDAGKAVANRLGIPEAEVVLRVIDLTKASYEIHTVDYDYMMAEGGYEAYYAKYLQGSTGWVAAPGVTPGNEPGTLKSTITASNAGTTGALAANTPYLIYMRPYITGTDGKKWAYYPNYVLATTLDVRPPLDIEPTTPVLRDDETTDTTATVYWLDMELEYELVYSERLANYPNSGTVIPWTQIEPAAEVKPNADDHDRPYMWFTIPNLFPDTTYYIWIRAKANNSSGPAYSNWSNPVEMKTKDITAPPPPYPGPAGFDHVNAYNRQAGTDYAPTDKDAIIIEWMRIDEDDNTYATGGTTTGGTVQALQLTELTSMYMARFEELIANRSYYVRAKTVKTITRTGEVNTLTYNYIIQMSLEPDFKDNIEFVIPTLTPSESLDPIYAKRKESPWSTTIRLVTARTTGEYDGDVNPDQYPLPTQDWEITYNATTQTIKYRFRSDQTDAQGNKDQLVDQRFISRLIANRTYVYAVDVTAYGNRVVNQRVVEFPYSILKAFDERKITLEVKADNLTLSILPGSFDLATVRALPDMGMGSQVRLTMIANATVPTLNAGESYISKPQKIGAQVITPTRALTVDSFAKPVMVAMAVNSRVTPSEQKAGLYLNTPNTGGWSAVGGSQYSDAAAAFSAQVFNTATYAGITRSTPASTLAVDSTRDAMYRVTAKVTINGLSRYNPGDVVSPNQFHNLLSAVAQNRASVDLYAVPSAADTQSLTRAGLMVSGALTREKAINSLVALYELKTKRVVRPADAAVSDINSADEAYRNSLLKAAEIGFFSGTARPKSSLTLGEFMHMLDIVIQDAGM